MLWYGMVWYDMAWYGMVWHGMAWYGTVWYGMVRYGIVCYLCGVGWCSMDGMVCKRVYFTGILRLRLSVRTVCVRCVWVCIGNLPVGAGLTEKMLVDFFATTGAKLGLQVPTYYLLPTTCYLLPATYYCRYYLLLPLLPTTDTTTYC